jgi:glucosamine-6-phosphate deaminase
MIMKLNVYDTPEEASKAAAEAAAGILREAVRAKGRAVFVAATGNSQIDFLRHLTATPGISWKQTTMFHLDEYIGIPSAHPASFRRYLRERLTSRIPVGNAHFIQGDAADLPAELARLNAAITAAAVDVAFIGIGENGHIAFNDPPADFAAETPFIVVDLDEACRRQQVGEGWFGSIDDVPRQAVSMSVKQIMKAARILCTVLERRKAEAVKACLEGEIGPMFPASILRTHAGCDVFLDRDAAGLLSRASLSA